MFTEKQYLASEQGLAADLDRPLKQGRGSVPGYVRGTSVSYVCTDDGLVVGDVTTHRTITTPMVELDPLTRATYAESEDIPDREGLLEEEVGQDGTNYQTGRVRRGTHREYDQPIAWRGLRTDYGTAHQIFLTSPVYQRPVNSAVQAIKSGIWSVQPAKVDEEFQDLAQVQADEVQTAVDSMEGGLGQFLTEAVYSLTVPGWGIWLRIHHPDGRLKKLAYRRPNTLDRVILNEGESKILGFEFVSPASSESYVVDVRDCLVLTAMRLGIDIEGLSPFRSVAEYVRAKQLCVERFMLSAEKHGTPQDVVEADENYQEAEGDGDKVANVLDARRGDEPASIILPKGLSLKTLSPSGAFPPVESFIRLMDEYISMPLSSEGALLGAGKTGSYALADVKDDQSLRVAVFVASEIADALNGVDNSDMTGPLRAMVDAMGGPPVPGAYPLLEFSLGEEEVPLADVVGAAAQGLITITPEVQDHIHERLKLPQVVREDSAEADGASVLLNGAQASSVVNIVMQVTQGLIPGDSAIKILEMVFQVPADVAAFIINPARETAEATKATQVRPLAASEGCGQHPAEFRDNPEHGNLFGEFDPEDAVDAHDTTNAKIAKQFESLAKKHRKAWVEATKGLTAAAAVLRIRDAFRERWMPQYREAALPAVDELRARGGLSIAREIGAIPKVPRNIKGAQTTGKTLQIADSIALRSYNTVEAYLLERTTLELNGAPARSLPPIPSRDAFEKHAAVASAAAFSQGRDEMVKELVDASQRGAPVGKEPRIIAEYSSVLDGNTCDPCDAADGRRVFVGSSAYTRLMPPSVCDGGNRCRCIYTYIMPDEADYAEIFEEVAAGFSQTGNTERFSEERWVTSQFARIYRESKGE